MSGVGEQTIDATLSLAILGPLEAGRNGATIDLGPPKQRAVLALLLLGRGTVVATDRLIDALWGEGAPPRAASSLHAYISNLRRALRAPGDATSPIVRRAPGYVLELGGTEIDLEVFFAGAADARAAAEAGDWSRALERADAALGLWRGDLLSDLADEEWVQAEARRLEELRLECAETRVSALLAGGRVAEALAAAGSLTTADPWRERGVWLAMIALYRAGRAPEALELFRDHADRLDTELGLEPGEPLRSLQLSILRQDPALAAWPRPPEWSGAEPVPVPASEPAPPVAPAPEPRRRAVRGSRARDHRAGGIACRGARRRVPLVLLTGPAGIGKTRLADEAVAQARALGGGEIWARCPEEDGSPAWWPIRQLVRALGTDPETLLTPPPGADSDSARFVLYERVADLLRREAGERRPLVVVVDDVQWIDAVSALCLAYVVGALRGTPLLLVLTEREGEAGNAVAPLLAALAREDGHRNLAVPALGAPEVAELAAGVAGVALPADEVERITERTGGNPLFVSEYARLAPEERASGTLPLAVRAVVGRRLSGLEPAVLEALQAAAVIGDVLELGLLQTITGLDIDALADRLDAAADAHVVVLASGAAGYAFAHGLVRDAVLASLPALRRQRLHVRVAAAVAASADRDRFSRRAQHLVAAGPLADAGDVLEACRAAALDADERWDWDVAAHWWEQATFAAERLDSAGATGLRDELRLARLEALSRAGHAQTVLDAIVAGMAEAMRDDQPETIGWLAAALLRSSGAWPWVAHAEQIGPMRMRLAEVEPRLAGAPAAQARVRAALAVGSTYDPDPGVPDRLSASAIEIAEMTGEPDVLADALLGRLLTYSGVYTHSSEAAELLPRLTALPHRHAQAIAPTLNALWSMVHMNLGDVEATERDVAEGAATADALRLPTVRVQLRWMSGELALWRGDFDLAERQFDNARTVHLQTELYARGTTEFSLGALHWERGTLADMQTESLTEPLAWGAMVAAARGERTEAARQLDAYLQNDRLTVWNTLGHRTLMAHLAADLELTGSGGTTAGQARAGRRPAGGDRAHRRHRPRRTGRRPAAGAARRVRPGASAGHRDPGGRRADRGPADRDSLPAARGPARASGTGSRRCAIGRRRRGGRARHGRGRQGRSGRHLELAKPAPRALIDAAPRSPARRRITQYEEPSMSATATPTASDLTIRSLNDRLAGDVRLPGDPAFAELATPWNVALAAHRPARAVVAAADATDVCTTVRFAAAHGLRIAVQCTGHGAAAFAGEDVIVLHTGRLDEITIDPATRTARIGAGLVWQQVIDAAAPYGLAPLCGSSPTVGVVGMLTGGGIGPLVRTYGLSGDYVRAFELVTGDGALLRVTAEEHADLFWALRGGKASVGIVTAVELELIDLPAFHGGTLFFDGADAPAVLHAWRAASAELPEATSTSVALLRLPPLPHVPAPLAGRLTVAVRIASVDGPDGAEAFAAPLLAVASPVLGGLGEMPYAAIGALHADPVDPMPVQEGGGVLAEISAEMIDALLAGAGPEYGLPAHHRRGPAARRSTRSRAPCAQRLRSPRRGGQPDHDRRAGAPGRRRGPRRDGGSRARARPVPDRSGDAELRRRRSGPPGAVLRRGDPPLAGCPGRAVRPRRRARRRAGRARCGMSPRNRIALRRTLAAAAVATAVAVPASAGAAVTETQYKVIAHAELTESWKYDELASDLCLDGCTRETRGSGSTHLDVASRPTTWLVSSEGRNRPPAIDVGTGEGALVRGEVRRTGSLAVIHGGEWAAANPPQNASTRGCGRKHVSFSLGLEYTSATRATPVATPDLETSCPTGPDTGLDWVGGQAPDLSEVVSDTASTRLLHNRSFTVRGSRTWRATVQPGDSTTTRSGSATATWRWSVQFTRVGRR